MRGTRKIKGIMFDMDNTLLQSRIDFSAMKRDVHDLLVQHGVLPADFPLQDNTTSTLLELAKQWGVADAVHQTLMEIVVRHELAGMLDAGLEPGVPELLAALQGSCTLVIITNNSRAAAARALEITGIARFFDLVVGREQMSALKPSPSGYNFAKGRFPHIQPDEWLSVGDSWIDGKASTEAGIPFIGYRTDREALEKKGVNAAGRVERIAELLTLLGG